MFEQEESSQPGRLFLAAGLGCIMAGKQWERLDWEGGEEEGERRRRRRRRRRWRSVSSLNSGVKPVICSLTRL